MKGSIMCGPHSTESRKRYATTKPALIETVEPTQAVIKDIGGTYPNTTWHN